MTYTTALTTLATLNVGGIAHNYGISVIPERIARAALPCLIVVPAFEDGSRREHGEFSFAAPSGTRALVQYYTTHLLLTAPIGSGLGAHDHLPDLIALLDSYAAAIKADPRLNNTLFHPLNYRVHIAPIDYGGVRYFGARLWHSWVIEA